MEELSRLVQEATDAHDGAVNTNGVTTSSPAFGGGSSSFVPGSPTGAAATGGGGGHGGGAGGEDVYKVDNMGFVAVPDNLALEITVWSKEHLVEDEVC